jgi:hypothetical protein
VGLVCEVTCEKTAVASSITHCRAKRLTLDGKPGIETAAESVNEQEVRLVIAQQMGGPVFPISPNWLTRIILGEHMSAADEQRIRQWAERRDPELSVVKASYEVSDRVMKLG